MSETTQHYFSTEYDEDCYRCENCLVNMFSAKLYPTCEDYEARQAQKLQQMREKLYGKPLIERN